MQSGWQRKPGDRVVRPPRTRAQRLRRVLGVAALYSTGYGNVGSSIYYALGIVALVAMGAMPVALAITGILFVCTALTYAEGTAMFPEAGGSASFARHGFNELASFIAGWALMFSYIVTISISAFTIPSYLGFFWAPLKDSPPVGTAVSMGIVFFLMIVNIIGVRESSLLNMVMVALDLTTQALLVVCGFVLIFNLATLTQRITDYWPAPSNLAFGIAIAAIAYTGVETMSQMAEETRRPQVRVPRALVLMMITVLVIFGCISVVALSAMTPDELASDWAKDPVAGIAHNLPVDWLRALLGPMVATLAATILLIATNAGLIGMSRLVFSMGVHQQLPPILSRLHPRFKTPHFSIILLTTVSLAILVPGLFGSAILTHLGGLYAFGSLLAFALAHASIVILRIKKPTLARPFKLGWNIRIKGREIPFTAAFGVAATLIIWIVVIIMQPYSRWVGSAWMLGGLAIYFVYRRRQHLPLTETHVAKQTE